MELKANALISHVKKNTKHGKKKGQNQNEHYENEKHSLQGKSGKVSCSPQTCYSLYASMYTDLHKTHAIC